jgi:hypothetical protein
MGVGVTLRLVVGVGLSVVIGVVILFALLAYASVNIPARHRVHSWGQVEQAVDNDFGVFGKSYPEESAGQAVARKVGRNDPCGSGQKFKRCCGATSRSARG